MFMISQKLMSAVG